MIVFANNIYRKLKKFTKYNYADAWIAFSRWGETRQSQIVEDSHESGALNRILLENYFFPADLEAQIETFIDHYNHRRYHESINNLTPADVYFGRGQSILKQREKIKLKTMKNRRLQHRKYAA